MASKRKIPLPTKRTTVRISFNEEMYREFRRIAKENNVSVEKIITNLIHTGRHYKALVALEIIDPDELNARMQEELERRAKEATKIDS